MPLTDSGVRSLTATDKMQKKGVGNCLYVVVEPSKKGRGKSFLRRDPFPTKGWRTKGQGLHRSLRHCSWAMDLEGSKGRMDPNSRMVAGDGQRPQRTERQG